jgi:5-formyltetrahydrofolate cyclo-ligase
LPDFLSKKLEKPLDSSPLNAIMWNYKSNKSSLFPFVVSDQWEDVASDVDGLMEMPTQSFDTQTNFAKVFSVTPDVIVTPAVTVKKHGRRKKFSLP